MNVVKVAMASAIGFAAGAGMMLMPGNQKMKRQAQKQVDRIMKISRIW